MSGIPRSKQLWITPLSPVHMGTDEDYTPTNYVIDDDVLYEFAETALGALPAIEKDKLNKILNGHATPAMLKQVQRFFYANREWFIPNAINVVKVSEELAAMYCSRIGKAANIESGGKEVQNRMEIERASYNPTHRRLYLPGTGLKGAMRTALLDEINSNKPLSPKLKDRKSPDRSGIARFANKTLQEELFRGSFSKDPMRLVQVGDCNWKGPAELNSAEILFAVNRKKHPVQKDGTLLQSQAEKQGLYQMLECAAPFRFRAFRGVLTISGLSNLDGQREKTPELRFTVSDIAAACNRFYRPIFDAEMETLQKRGYLDTEWRNTVTEWLNDPNIRQRLQSNDIFLLRAGRHSGADSVTLNGVRSIKIMKGKGNPPDWLPEAKTLWLATGSRNDQRHLRPFGWLLVELSPIDGPPPEWASAETLTGKATESMTRWLAKVRTRQQELAKKAAAAHQAAEQRARAEAEQRQREEEQARRWADMSEEERMIEKLRQRLEQDRQAGKSEAGGELNQQRLTLLEEALRWENPTLRQHAAGLLEETARFLPWAKKRRQEVREKLARLKGLR